MAYPQYAGNGGIAAAQDDYVDIPFPTTVNQYDILIATVLDADNDTFVVPTGWNAITTLTGSNASTVACFWRRADGTETGTQRFYSNSAAGLVIGGIMARFTGCIRTGTPYGASVTAGVTFSDTVTLPAINPAGNERLVCAFIGVEDNKTLAQASNYTQQYHVLDTTGSDFALGLQTQQVAFPQTIGAETALLQAGIAENWGTISISLIPPTKHLLQGGIVTYANVTGDLKKKLHLEGAVSATSSVSGDVKAKRGLAGAIQAAASVVGALSLTATMAGAINATSTVSGDLKAMHQIQGAISAQSTVFGDLRRIGPTWELEGHINEQSDVFADSMYPVPQWTLVKQYTGKSYGDVMGFDDDNHFLAMAWTPEEDVTLGGIQVWLSQEDKLPPETPMTGGIWRDGGLGQGPEPWDEIPFSAMTERRADRIAAGTSNTGGGLYTFEFGLYDIGKPSLKAGEKYYFIFYPYFGGTDPEKTIWWHGDGVFDASNERWRGKSDGELWWKSFGGTRYIKIYAAQNQVHSLEGHVEQDSALTGELLKGATYYVRADGTATSKEDADSPNSASTSMSPSVWASETFEPGDKIIWSAKGGDYEEVNVYNGTSEGTADHPIVMRGEFGGAGRPWISGGIEISAGPWTQDGANDRWWISLPDQTFSVVADGVDLGDSHGALPTQPGDWYYSISLGRLYMGGSSPPSSQYSKIWVQKTENAILGVGSDHWVFRDLLLTLGRPYLIGGPSGLEASYTNDITIERVDAIGHNGIAFSLPGIQGLKVDDCHVTGAVTGIDISDSTSSDGPILQRSSFNGIWGTAVRIENESYTENQWIRRVQISAFERCFTLENMSGGLIEQCSMEPHEDGADALLSGVNIIDAVYATTIRNCRVAGTLQNMMLAGVAVPEPYAGVQIAFVNNEVNLASSGAAFINATDDEAEVEAILHNNTVVNTGSGFYQLLGRRLRVSIRNNVFFNQVGFLDDPLGAIIWDGTAEEPGYWVSADYNHYRDPRKPLIFFYKTGVISFAAYQELVEVGGHSYEANPQLENAAAGEFWLAAGSPAHGTGDSGVYNSGWFYSWKTADDWALGLVPDSWPNPQVANHNDYEDPSWNRGAYLPEGSGAPHKLQGAINSWSLVQGDLKVVPHELEGHIGAQSSISGNLTVLPGGAALPLKGSIGGKSSLYGDLFSPTTWSLEGHIAAQSHFEGKLYAPDRHQLAGAIAAQSSLSGDLGQNFLLSLEGAIEAQSALSADLMATRGLAGSIDAQSSLSGDLTMIEALWELEGHVAAQSALAADLRVHTPIEGHIAAQSSISGELSVRHSLAGAIEAQSAVSGELVTTRKLEGHVAAQSSMSGALGRIHPLAGAINAQSTVSGDLTQIDAVWDLEGHVAAKTTLAGNLIVGQTLAIDDADHGHTAEGAKEINGSVVGLNGTYYYDLKPGGQLLEFSFDAIFGYQVTVGVARNIVPISTQYLTIRQNSTKDLIITDEDPGDLYVSTNFFTWGQHYIFHVILYEDSTLSVYVNGSHKWTGSVKPALLTFEHGTGWASTPNNFELISWNYPTLDLLQHHFISIDEALHGHAADVPLLVENIDLVIDDALHGHTADEPTVAVTHHLEIDDAFHLSFAEELDLVEGITLSIDDATHGHSADGLDLDQAHVLAINDAAHYHISDPLALGGTGYLGINHALHGHAADNVVLTQHHQLAIDDALHGHSADGITLAVTSYLAIDDALHGHAADALTLPQNHVLAIDDSLHGHSADEPTLAVTSYLAIDDSIHGHQSDNLNLVENIDLEIDSAIHQHTAEGLALTVIHMLEIDDAAHSHIARNLDLTQGIALTIDSATHAHETDSLTLAEKSLLSIQDSFHLHQADEVPLAGGVELVVDNAVHSHTADAIALQQTHVLEIDDCLHLHRAEGLPISTVGILGIMSAKHAHFADPATLSQVHSISIDDASHGHAADELTLSEKSYLVIDSAEHGHAADPLDLDQNHVLAIDNCSHGHACDPCNLTPTPILEIADAVHMHWAEVVSLTQDHTLAINDAAHGVTSDNLEVPQVHTLAIDDCSHDHAADEVAIEHHHFLTIDDCLHSHTADALPVIPQNSVLQIDDAAHAVTSPEIEVVSLVLVIDDATHAVTSDEIPIVVGFYLEIDDALHDHAADALVFTQQHILAVEDALHEVASDELTLDTPWYDTQRAAAIAEEACTVATVDDYGITATLDEDCIDVRVYPSEEDCT